MKLSIIIPAYNEEKAIAAIIEQCVAAKSVIVQETSLNDLEIIVVNDGSQDATAEIAARYRDQGLIHLISYAKNRGYGAAIKEGFSVATGDYLSFLDADGTCNPKWFVDLFRILQTQQADISIGSRMSRQSEMPWVRRVGNSLYVSLINLIANQRITDSASGMRILHRDVLEKIYPLPDGLNFTPAMSAKAILDPRLKIVEVFIPYKERIGTSKLNVVKDGLRFLRTILEISFFYKPLKLFALAAAILFAVSLCYGIPLLAYYLSHRSLHETDFYRILTIVVMGVLGTNLLLLGISADLIESVFTNRPVFSERAKNFLLKYMLMPRSMFGFGAVFILAGIGINHDAIREYLLFRTVHIHWSYIVTGAFLVLLGAEIASYAFKVKLLWMYKDFLEFRKKSGKREGFPQPSRGKE